MYLLVLARNVQIDLNSYNTEPEKEMPVMREIGLDKLSLLDIAIHGESESAVMQAIEWVARMEHYQPPSLDLWPANNQN